MSNNPEKIVNKMKRQPNGIRFNEIKLVLETYRVSNEKQKGNFTQTIYK